MLLCYLSRCYFDVVLMCIQDIKLVRSYVCPLYFSFPRCPLCFSFFALLQWVVPCYSTVIYFGVDVWLCDHDCESDTHVMSLVMCRDGQAPSKKWISVSAYVFWLNSCSILLCSLSGICLCVLGCESDTRVICF